MIIRDILTKGVLAVVVVTYLYGFVLGAIGLGVAALQGVLPNWSWWQYFLAPFLIGAVAMLLEAFWIGVTKVIGRDHVTDPLWKRSARIFVIFTILATMIIGPALYRIGY